MIKRCWDVDSNKRPTVSEIKKIIRSWYSYYNVKSICEKVDERVDEKLQNDMMEFQKADKISEQEQTKISLINNNPINYVSYSLDFTENLNKFLEEDNNF